MVNIRPCNLYIYEDEELFKVNTVLGLIDSGVTPDTHVQSIILSSLLIPVPAPELDRRPPDGHGVEVQGKRKTTFPNLALVLLGGRLCF